MTSTSAIEVVGGVYGEQCLAPARREISGSGGRAAAVIAVLGGNPTLTTYLDAATREEFLPIATAQNFAFRSQNRPWAITFGYTHPLAVPTIVPPRHRLTPQEPLRISASRLLRFGMIEGAAVVDAEYAVYDPQDPEDPESFQKNGSTARHLVLIVNRREAHLLIGSKAQIAIDVLARRLAEQEQAEVVIIKGGPAGALLYDRTSNAVAQVPAFRTSKVWKIGSGDAFSGAFAHYSMNASMTPEEAAFKASLASAHYCAEGDVTALLDMPSLGSAHPTPQEDVSRKRQVYLAGPFFTTSELWLVTEAWRFLIESGIAVFSPYHEVGRGSAHDVAPKDIAAIKRSSVVLALLDGFDPGTVFEVGYARARDIPVVALAENTRAEDLKMIEGSGCELFTDLAAALYRVAALA
jgi:hypothetical protein